MPTLTQTQNDTLKTFILGDSRFDTSIPGIDPAYAIADLLATFDAVPFQVWRTQTNVNDIYDNVVWANFTPANPTIGDLDYTNRALACQGKQFNLQTLLYHESVNTSKTGIRAGLQDALTQIPSGAAGATKSGGWTNVLLVIQRPANILEKLFAVGTGTAALPATMEVEGRLNYQQVLTAMGW